MKREQLGLLLGILAFLLLLFYINPKKLLIAIFRIDIPFFIMMILVSFSIFVLYTIRFQQLLSKLYGNHVTFSDFFRIYMASNMFNYLSPARTGEAIKTYFLMKKYKIPYNKSAAVVSVEKIQELTSICLITMVLLWGEVLPPFENFHIIAFILMVMVVILAVVMMSERAYRFLEKIPFIRGMSIEEEAHRFRKSLILSIRSWLFIYTLFQMVIIHILSATRLYLLFLSLHSSPPFFSTILIYFIAQIIGVLSFIPGSLGAFDISATMLYKEFLYLDLPVIGASIFLLRATTYLIEIPLGLIFAYSLNLFKKKE